MSITPAEFEIVMRAIPSGAQTLHDYNSDNSSCSVPKISETHCGKVCFSLRKNNKAIRCLFQSENSMKPHVTVYWSKYVHGINWTKTWSLPCK